MIKAIICDFDFTLADSSPGVVACANEALRSLGLPEASAEHIRATIGLSMAHTLRQLTGREDPALVATFTERFVAHADQVMHGLTTLYPWVAETVQTLRARSCRLGIVSSKYRYRIARILDEHGLAPHFDVIVGGEDVSQHKPDPAGLHLALQRFGLSTAEVLYIGDHPVDAQAASSAGVPFMAVLTGTSARASFAPYRVQRFLADFSHVPHHLPALDTTPPTA
jgi:phosphoglycolate phosphatase